MKKKLMEQPIRYYITSPGGLHIATWLTQQDREKMAQLRKDNPELTPWEVYQAVKQNNTDSLDEG